MADKRFKRKSNPISPKGCRFCGPLKRACKHLERLIPDMLAGAHTGDKTRELWAVYQDSQKGELWTEDKEEQFRTLCKRTGLQDWQIDFLCDRVIGNLPWTELMREHEMSKSACLTHFEIIKATLAASPIFATLGRAWLKGDTEAFVPRKG